MVFEDNYYESKSWVKVFSSPYASTATVNHINKHIPMNGLLVQRSTEDIRGAVYWNSNQLYNTNNNMLADSGYAYRKVMLGYAGGHGIYNTSQNSCNWQNSIGAIGAGYDGTNCGSFPNGLKWGTGVSGNSVYTNRSGTWEHWATWS